MRLNRFVNALSPTFPTQLFVQIFNQNWAICFKNTAFKVILLNTIFEKHCGKCRLSFVKWYFKSKNDVSLSKNDVSLSKNDVPLSKNDVSLSKNDVSLSQNDVHLPNLG